MSPYSKPELTYLQSGRRLRRLATVGPDDTPHVTPVSPWTVDPDSGVIEIADRWNRTATKKFRDAARTAPSSSTTCRSTGGHGQWRSAAALRPSTARHRSFASTRGRIISWGIDDDDPGARSAHDADR